MERQQVYEMLEKEGILPERLRDAHKERLKQKGNFKQYPRAGKKRSSPETGGSDRAGLSKKVQEKKKNPQKKA
jgi:hypothetical protein